MLLVMLLRLLIRWYCSQWLLPLLLLLLLLLLPSWLLLLLLLCQQSCQLFQLASGTVACCIAAC